MKYVIACKLPWNGKKYYKGGTYNENGVVHAKVCDESDEPKVYESYARALRAAKGLNRKCELESIYFPEEHKTYLNSKLENRRKR